MRAGEPRPDGLEAALRRLAAEAAPALVEEVLEKSRRDAAETVRRRLSAALVEEMERLLRRAACDPGPASSGPTPASRPRPSTPDDPSTVVPLVRPQAPPETQERRGWYVYGITRADVAGVLDIRSGVDGAPVEAVGADGLAAVVSPLADTTGWDIDTKGEGGFEALASRARAHEAVLERLMDLGPVLPLRFGVLYPDVDRLRGLLVGQAEALQRALGDLEGHSEWGLTITSEAEGGTDATLPGPDDGRDYLSRRRDARRAAETRAEQLAGLGSALHEELQGLAAGAVAHRAVSPSGRGAEAVLRASYLVSTESAGAFRETCESLLRLAPPELRLSGELTGPWPPYHFCDVSLEEVPA